MLGDPPNELEATLTGLERGLTVAAIAASPLRCCSPEDVVAQVRSNPDFADFDNVPVRREGRIVGLLQPGKQDPVKRAVDAMISLSDTPLVSGAEPLLDFILHMEEHSGWLVVRGREIDAIVTRSDLLKLPVRIVAFTLIAHLEQLLNQLIRAERPDDSWLNDLEPKWRQRTEKRHKDLSSQNLNLEKLEAATLLSKIQVAQAILGPDSTIEGDLNGIEDLRNDLAHARDIIDKGEEGVAQFIGRLGRARDWCRELARRASPESRLSQ